ncbi:MAG: hypothetical protein JXA01_02430 [Dehalococcoidia bacterium]|nr:hypothetical protein [Dehalococcoidia bacterium]
MFSSRKIFQAVFPLIIMLTACNAGFVVQPDSSNQINRTKAEIREAARPYSLDLVDWEIKNLITPVNRSPDKCLYDIDGEIAGVLQEENMTVIPAVYSRVTEPPLLLVVSPKDRIAYLDRLLLSPDLNLSQIEAIEEGVDALNLSSIVVEIGGFGAAYPAIVSSDMSLRRQIYAASEEWAHQYLAFRPLGFRYLLDCLGMSQPPEVIEMNETLAGIIAEEIGDKVYNRYYQTMANYVEIAKPDPDFNFDREMKETRKNVDILLKANNIEQAEQYMENRRLLFLRQGYTIRKLNQAYFAFHGIYGQDPCAVSPIYDAMCKLRRSYEKLAGFTRDVSNMISYEDLLAAVERQSAK